MKAYALRTYRVLTRSTRFWIVVDGTHQVTGKIGESLNAVISRFEQAHGKITRLVRYAGIMRPSEAAITIADIERKTVQAGGQEEEK